MSADSRRPTQISATSAPSGEDPLLVGVVAVDEEGLALALGLDLGLELGARWWLALRGPRRSSTWGGIRSAPSRRMVSPLSIGLVTMCAARSANSAGSPRRLGKGIALPSSSRASSGSAASSGVSNVPGAIVSTRTPAAREVARGRQGQADDPALRGRVGDLADLAVEGGDRGRVDADAALAAVVGLVVDHRRGGEAEHVEGADQVDLDHVVEDLEVVRRPACRRSAGPSRCRRSRPRSAARPRPRPRRRPRPATGSGSITLASTKRARSPSSADERLALLGVEVGDDHARAVAVQHARSRLAEARGPADDQRAGSLDLHRRENTRSPGGPRPACSLGRSRALRRHR